MSILTTPMPRPPFKRATLDDLLKTEGKAELIGGRIVPFMATGYLPNVIAGRIFRSLADHGDSTGTGTAFTDSMGFAIPELPNGRESFSADTSFYDGPIPAKPMRFVEGPPDFAVEVRSENDYTPSAEAAIVAKRTDYFAAGTQVVWNVDALARIVLCYHADRPNVAVRFVAGHEAEAEPAVRNWRIAVDRIFG